MRKPKKKFDNRLGGLIFFIVCMIALLVALPFIPRDYEMLISLTIFGGFLLYGLFILIKNVIQRNKK